MIRIHCCCVLLLLMLATLACDAHGPLSNTGYTGTWERGNDRARSILAIVEWNGQYLVRKSVHFADGRHTLRCEWNGHCEEFVDGEKTSEYTFRSWVDPKSKRLWIECRGTISKPAPLELHYVDELLLKDEGLRIRARTVEQQGRKLTKGLPKRDYRKVSNSVSDPPAGWSAERG
jgi:hypothetical protein